MQHNSNGKHLFEKNVSNFDRVPRRLSTSGFEYPKDLFNIQYTHNFSSIPETKYQNLLPLNMANFHIMNGDCEKKSEMTNHNFFSEINVNQFNHSQSKTTAGNAFDLQHNSQNSNPLPRFSSTPLIAQLNGEHSQQNNQPITFNPSFFQHSTFNRQINPHHTTDSSMPYVQSPYVLYDLRTNSYQNVILYPSEVPETIDSNYDTDCYGYSTTDHQTEDYEDLIEFPGRGPSDLNENYLRLQSNIIDQHSVDERNRLSKYVQDDLMYFLPPELPNDLTDLNRAESQSMPSLHGDDSAESDFDSSEDDQLNTVHGEEMLHELQKLSSVFTNVVNLPMSQTNQHHHSESAEFLGQRNLSRFKRTRIKERTTFWQMERFIVKDNLVKIIPEKVFNIRPLDLDRLEMLELELFGCQLSKQEQAEDAVSSAPDCVHSMYPRQSTPIDTRFYMHSSRNKQKYRSSFNSRSPTDHTPLLANQQLPPGFIQTRHTHRKSMQIPLRIPVVWNTNLPMLSPVLQHRTRMCFEPNSHSNGKNLRRKRRWSVSGTKLEKNNSSHSLRSHNHRHGFDPTNRVKYDHGNFDHVDDKRHSLDLDASIGDGQSQISTSLEMRLDHHLMSLKRTVLSYVETNLSEIREEVRSLRGSHVSLEKQLKYYKEKVHLLEHSVRQNLPEEQWTNYGVIIDSNNNGSSQR